MSTTYYQLKEPFTSIRVERSAAHDRITLWENGANAGTLTVTAGLGTTVALIFADEAVLRTTFGGDAVGLQVHELEIVQDDCTLISAYGEACTAGDVRERSETGKRRGGSF